VAGAGAFSLLPAGLAQLLPGFARGGQRAGGGGRAAAGGGAGGGLAPGGSLLDADSAGLMMAVSSLAAARLLTQVR